MALVATISQIQNNLREGRIPNEAAVSLGVVRPYFNPWNGLCLTRPW